MRKLILLCSIILFTAISCKEAAKEEEKVMEIEVSAETAALKDHQCTDACHTAGKCVFVHGEKGHECTESCNNETAALKDHECSDACKIAGKCVYTHGEKGHECTDACKS